MCRWCLDVAVLFCRRMAAEMFREIGAGVKAGDDVRVNRSVRMFVFWSRLGMSLSPRPCVEFAVPVPEDCPCPDRSSA